jgi:hypothetical protein
MATPASIPSPADATAIGATIVVAHVCWIKNLLKISRDPERERERLAIGVGSKASERARGRRRLYRGMWLVNQRGHGVCHRHGRVRVGGFLPGKQEDQLAMSVIKKGSRERLLEWASEAVAEAKSARVAFVLYYRQLAAPCWLAMAGLSAGNFPTSTSFIPEDMYLATWGRSCGNPFFKGDGYLPIFLSIAN